MGLFFGFVFLNLQSFVTQDPGDRGFLVKNLGSLDVPVINHMGESHDAEPFHVSEGACFVIAPVMFSI